MKKDHAPATPAGIEKEGANIMSALGAIFGGGGGAPAPPAAPPAAAAPAGPTAASRARSRRIGRAALIRSDQENVLAATTGRNILTAV